MSIKTRAQLKGYLETNDVPTQGQYADLVDSVPNLADDNFAPGFNVRGAWSSVTNYIKDDVVVYGGEAYVCLIYNTNVLPTVATNWLKITEKGVDGKEIVSVSFVGNDMVFVFDDASTFSLVDAAITLKGDTGTAATITIGTTSTLAPGESAAVINSGTDTAAVLEFGIPKGVAGVDAFVYIAYASADDGTDFTNTFNSALDYIAIKSTTTAIASPVASDFVGLWKNYKGLTGAAGLDGACVESVAFVGDDMVFTLDNASTVVLTGAKTTLTGPQGVSIDSIIKTGTVGLVDTYTITYSDSTTSTLDVTNGADGTGDVNGPASSVDNNIAVFDGITGKIIKDGGVTVASKVTANTAITGATKTKITYDAKGLVTAGADATTSDIADSTNKRYVTDAQLTVIGNTSGTNSGDVTVTDSTEIDFTLTGQNITASIKSASIDESKLDTSVNASLDLADSSVQPTSTNTLTNKRNQPRVYSTTTLTTLTPEVASYNIFTLTAQASALTIANHSTSTPANGEMILIEMVCDGTARALNFGTNYVAKAGTALPTTLVASKRTTLLFVWCSDISKYNLLTVGQE